jgi:hypothetical protein
MKMHYHHVSYWILVDNFENSYPSKNVLQVKNIYLIVSDTTLSFGSRRLSNPVQATFAYTWTINIIYTTQC